jgi:hypothetical protein
MGIFWLILTAWDGESLGYEGSVGHTWWAVIDAFFVVLAASMAYHHLTKSPPIVITIRPDTTKFDAAMKRAMEQTRKLP